MRPPRAMWNTTFAAGAAKESQSDSGGSEILSSWVMPCLVRNCQVATSRFSRASNTDSRWRRSRRDSGIQGKQSSCRHSNRSRVSSGKGVGAGEDAGRARHGAGGCAEGACRCGIRAATKLRGGGRGR
ncbi:unnamed protein product [Symbiodinium necroappetens]|uniref:Uncharacterized protein n=1 Tax=Symbiodinium necroappetens TaxID=1628268 RepID=A0A813B1W6_9DINO|nr:unnamed protein product [Symbiodinium necroappetens]